MNRIIITNVISAIAIILAAIFGFFKFRPKSKEPKQSDNNEFASIKIESEKADENNANQNNDCNISAFNRLQKCIDLNWIQNFEYNQLTKPQYVQEAVTDDLHLYWNESKKPENAFFNQKLAEAHLLFIKAIKAFLRAVIQETTFVRPESKVSVINSKAEGHRIWLKDYDERFDREVKIITRKTEGIINAYKRYVQVARSEGVYRQNN